MRAGYKLQQMEFNSIYEGLYAPSGEHVAQVTHRSRRDRDEPYAVVKSRLEGSERRVAADRDELQDILEAITDEHYRLTTTAGQRFHDRLNKWVDYPIVKLLGIAAAIVAAVASVFALARELST